MQLHTDCTLYAVWFMFCLGHYNFKLSLSLPGCLFSEPRQHFQLPLSALMSCVLSQMFEHLFHSLYGFFLHTCLYVFCFNRMNFDSVPYSSELIIMVFLYLVPSPPTFFTKAINSTAVQVLWELPSKPGKTEGFRLSYRRVPHGEIQGPIQLPCHVNVHTFSRLGERKRVSVCVNHIMQQ